MSAAYEGSNHWLFFWPVRRNHNVNSIYAGHHLSFLHVTCSIVILSRFRFQNGLRSITLSKSARSFASTVSLRTLALLNFKLRRYLFIIPVFLLVGRGLAEGYAAKCGKNACNISNYKPHVTAPNLLLRLAEYPQSARPYLPGFPWNSLAGGWHCAYTP